MYAEGAEEDAEDGGFDGLFFCERFLIFGILLPCGACLCSGSASAWLLCCYVCRLVCVFWLFHGFILYHQATMGVIYVKIRSGSVAEWLKAHDSKSCGQQCLGGSNPLASATSYRMTRGCAKAGREACFLLQNMI